MAKAKSKQTEETHATTEEVRLSLSIKPSFKRFSIWLVGDTPLICHAWSEKARGAMLLKQVKGTKPGKEARNPQEDFINCLYDMGNGDYGFPVTGVKKCIMSAAHKDRGIARTDVMGGLWLNAEMVRTRPALAGAICDMPLVRIHGSQPEMREDMVRIGAGLSKTANLAYRAQFTVWALKITGRFDPATITAEALAFLTNRAGTSSGIGEWRNERHGVFGAFHLADADEEEAWETFKNGGALPVSDVYKMAAE